MSSWAYFLVSVRFRFLRQKLPVCKAVDDLYQVKFMEFHYMKKVLCILIIQEISFAYCLKDC